MLKMLYMGICYIDKISEMLQSPNTACSYVSRIYIWNLLFVENFPEFSNLIKCRLFIISFKQHFNLPEDLLCAS